MFCRRDYRQSQKALKTRDSEEMMCMFGRRKREVLGGKVGERRTFSKGGRKQKVRISRIAKISASFSGSSL